MKLVLKHESPFASLVDLQAFSKFDCNRADRIITFHTQSEPNSNYIMSIFSIDFFVLGRHVNLEVPWCLPFMLGHFDFGHFLFEDGIADDTPEQPVTNILVLLIFIHEVLQEQGEILDKHKESSYSNSEYFTLQIQVIFNAHNCITLSNFTNPYFIVFFVLRILQ